MQFGKFYQYHKYHSHVSSIEKLMECIVNDLLLLHRMNFGGVEKNVPIIICMGNEKKCSGTHKLLFATHRGIKLTFNHYFCASIDFLFPNIIGIFHNFYDISRYRRHLNESNTGYFQLYLNEIKCSIKLKSWQHFSNKLRIWNTKKKDTNYGAACSASSYCSFFIFNFQINDWNKYNFTQEILFELRLSFVSLL